MSTTEFLGSLATTQPRFTATLVVPTPPVAPATAITMLPRDFVSPRPKRRSRIRSRAPTKSSMRTGFGRNSLAPARIARRISDPSLDPLTTSTLQFGDVWLSCSTSCNARSGSLSSETRPMSGCVCATTSEKNS